MLSPEQQEELARALRGPAPDGGAWTSQKVAAWISQRTGRPTYPQRGWVYLRKLGASGNDEPGRKSAAD